MDTEALKKSLLTKFVEVTQDRLQAIQLGILELEKAEADRAAEAVARDLHTMKGEARMLGLAAIGQLAHCCEDLLKAEREKKVDTRSATDLLLHGCDAISDLLDDLDAAKEGNEASADMAGKLAAAAGTPVPPLKPAARASAPAARPKPAATAPMPAKAPP
ncbi:MAG: Hpt domain-containing protein, partial [Myxococcota bacterium]